MAEAFLQDSGGTQLTVQTDLSDRAIIGGDTTILAVPKVFYVSLDPRQEPALAVVQLSRWLRKLAAQQATDVGERLHHAEFVITVDPAVVMEKGIMPEHADCPECLDGLATAMAYMERNPGKEMLVGQLFWAGGRR